MSKETNILVQRSLVLGYAVVVDKKTCEVLARPMTEYGLDGSFGCDVEEGEKVIGVLPAIPGTEEIYAVDVENEEECVIGYEYPGRECPDWQIMAVEVFEGFEPSEEELEQEEAPDEE